jgi:hypothetical protein
MLKGILQSFSMDSRPRGKDMKRKITLKSGNYACSKKIPNSYTEEINVQSELRATKCRPERKTSLLIFPL